MFISKVDGLIPKDTVAEIVRLLEGASWANGHISGGNTGNKHNLELAAEEKNYLEALKLTESAVRDNAEFCFTAFPRYMTRPIFSRYDVGMYYKAHTDYPIVNFMASQAGRPQGHRGLAPVGSNYIRTDLSMTIFLSDPSTYDGGELAFPSSMEQLRVKLEPGSAVLYPTGVPHEVREVTRGSRLVSVFWCQTLFPVEAQRKTVCDAKRLVSLLYADDPESPEFDMAEQVYHSVCRMFAEV
jgi:PKHD-type hydroxylase